MSCQGTDVKNASVLFVASKTFASSSPSLQLHGIPAFNFSSAHDLLPCVGCPVSCPHCYIRELTIQHVFWDGPVSYSMDMAKPSQTPLA